MISPSMPGQLPTLLLAYLQPSVLTSMVMKRGVGEFRERTGMVCDHNDPLEGERPQEGEELLTSRNFLSVEMFVQRVAVLLLPFSCWNSSWHMSSCHVC